MLVQRTDMFGRDYENNKRNNGSKSNLNIYAKYVYRKVNEWMYHGWFEGCCNVKDDKCIEGFNN